LDFLGEVGIDKLLPTALGEELHQGFHGPQVGDVGDLAQIFPRELLLPQRMPAACKAAVPSQKRLGESTMLPERILLGRRQLGRWLNLPSGQTCAQAFADAPWMHAILLSASKPAIPSTKQRVILRDGGLP
jgi:hypothetical protein